MADVTGSITVGETADAAALLAAEFIATQLAAQEGVLRIGMTGGSTSRALYAHLASTRFVSRLPWNRMELFWGDERFVPFNHSDSNFGMARDTLLSNPAVTPRGIYPMPTDTTPQDGTARYETTLYEYYGAAALNPSRPLFDLLLLGLGADGHIASLFPGQAALDERSALTATGENGGQTRLTLTYPALNSARRAVFLVAGAAKNGIVARVRALDKTLPAARLTPVGETFWFVDRMAGGAA